MNKKIAMSAMSVFSALAVMGGATFAAFTSVASNNGNTLAAGTMTFSINGAPGATSTALFSLTGTVPGDEENAQLDLSLGALDAPASAVKVTNIDINSDPGGLASVLTLQIGLDDGSNGGTANDGIIDTVLGNAHLDSAGWSNFTLPGVTIPSGGTVDLAAKLIFDAGAGNQYQGDAINFDINLEAVQ